ncbi:hypothetical protein ZIOFF_020919 [Zingiber officinale]|uniref:PLATZ transcription factor family protein n=1 Tax=Zingiber officinale TaxID=94328 RepID=A0A8J5HAQ5_ZINOF|nr:hypothetical protein ZIOFF_020919 [Zingiber officinale]
MVRSAHSAVTEWRVFRDPLGGYTCRARRNGMRSLGVGLEQRILFLDLPTLNLSCGAVAERRKQRKDRAALGCPRQQSDRWKPLICMLKSSASVAGGAPLPSCGSGIDWRRRRHRAGGAAMMMRRVAASLVPPWLETLLSTNFFSACALHTEAPRSECNMFCLDCGGAASSFCFYCRSDSHSGHRVIQIRRSSYHDVVRVAEIQKVLDISGVQTYVINSARVLFLNKRPQPHGGGGRVGGASSSSSSPHICEICARSLLDLFRFCSLGCKVSSTTHIPSSLFASHRIASSLIRPCDLINPN